MSASDSTRSDESTESMALFGQHKRISDPTAAGATPTLARQSGLSRRLQDILSECQTDREIDREMWSYFRAYSRSADWYLKEYLHSLQRVDEERPRLVYEINDFNDEVPPTDVAERVPNSSDIDRTENEWDLKIKHDSLARDLLAMHELLEFLKTRVAPSLSKGALPIVALSISAATLGTTLWWYSRPIVATGVLVANVASVACNYSSEIRNWLRTESIKGCQRKIEDLLRRLSKGEVGEWDRENFRGTWFRIVDYYSV